MIELAIKVEEALHTPTIEPVDISKGITTLIIGLSLIVGIPIAYLLIRKILNTIALKRMKSYTEDLLLEAQGYERSGRFVSAGNVYEKLKDYERAASLYERGKDYQRAAELYESLGNLSKTKQMYLALGQKERAADIALSMGDFPEAARIYKEIGLVERAAEALEEGGNLLAAARQYREAGNYIKSAELLREGGMPIEAVEMFKIALKAEPEPNPQNIDLYYKYLTFLESADMKEELSNMVKKLYSVDPDYKDLKERLSIESETEHQPTISSELIGNTYPSEPEDALKRTTTLRSIMNSGAIEPRYALRLWVSVLKAIAREHIKSISPEYITIDSENNIRFSQTGDNIPSQIDNSQDIIKTMGDILYEMLTGRKGDGSPSDIAKDVPPWLDELTLRCTDRNRKDSFKTIEDIFITLKEIASR